jgi:hypothetical protein
MGAPGGASPAESRILASLTCSAAGRALCTAVGRVVWELGDSLLYPIYRRHKELVPDELKGELL